jgi:hypothetical protein
VIGNRSQTGFELLRKQAEFEMAGDEENARLTYLEYLKHLGGNGIEGVVPTQPVNGEIYSYTGEVGLVSVISNPFNGRLVTARLAQMPEERENLIGLKVMSATRKWFDLPIPDNDRGMIVYGFVFVPSE